MKIFFVFSYLPFLEEIKSHIKTWIVWFFVFYSNAVSGELICFHKKEHLYQVTYFEDIAVLIVMCRVCYDM